VDALAEREMFVVRTGAVQRLGFREPLWIVVSERDHDHHQLAFRGYRFAGPYVFPGEAFGRDLHWAVVAKQFFDGGLDKRGGFS
jgi:hypothetical protein